VSNCVLDASALLTVIYEERGSAAVTDFIAEGAAISTVNIAEVAAKLHEAGQEGTAIRAMITSLRLETIAFDATLAYRAGALRLVTKPLGLSLGDRACLALAQQLGVPAITADRAWSRLSLDIPIHVIR
jgi:PIN domain nuclease of toxin-antitoxin system